MRVLVKKSKDDTVNHIFSGLSRVLIKVGIQPVEWDCRLKPSFDAFDELKPDLFLASEYDLSTADAKCLNENRQCLFVLHKAYPAINQIECKPDLEFQNVRDGLTTNGISLTCAMDVLNNFRPNMKAMFSISAIANREKYETYLRELSDLNMAIFSEEDLGVNQYFGSHIGHEVSIYNRSFLSIIFGNKYEANHRLYDCIKYGGLPLVEFNETDQKLLRSSMPTFQTVADIKEWIKYYHSYPQHRQQATKTLITQCLAQHTYYDRAIKLFGELGLDDIVAKVSEIER